MIRILLALALLLPLRPTVAEAGVDARAHSEQDRIEHLEADYAHEIQRAGTGVELLRRIDSHGPRCAGCSHRTGHGPTGGPHLLGGREPVALLVRELSPGAAEEIDGIAPPLCERLPYFATAPPSRR